MHDWNDLQHLMALAQHRTLPLAAESLGVNRTTVARRIEQLETDLGVKLVEKVGRDLVLTPAGTEAVSTAQIIDGEMQNLERQVFGRDEQLAGVIRLTTTQGLACLLAPCFSNFLQIYPELILDVSVTNASEDLELMESDIALRFTTNPPEALVGRKIGKAMIAVYANKRFAKDLPGLDVVPYIGTHVTTLLPKMEFNKQLKKVMQTNSVDLAQELVASGKGVSLLPCYMGEGDDRLVRITGTHHDLMPYIWLLYHPRLRSQLRIRKFVEHLVNCFEELKPVFEGEARPR